MYIDLNVPVPTPAIQPQSNGQGSKKNKGKQSQTQAQSMSVEFSASQIIQIESRIDLLVRLGYSVLALTQLVISKIDPKSHTNSLDALLPKLRKREGVLLLKRLTIELNNESEKGFGLTQANSNLFNSYDIISLRPTTPPTLSLACLTHSLPSSLTAHIISLPLKTPQALRLKHTLVRTALRNGANFEIEYSGALEDNDSDRRNWWAGAREVTRATKGKGIIISGGSEVCQMLRAPRDAGNLLVLAGLAQDQAHHAATSAPKSLIVRAQTRKTYRAIFSEPKLIMPEVNNEHSDIYSHAFEVENASNAPTTVPAAPEFLPSEVGFIEKATPAPQNAAAKKRTHDQIKIDEIRSSGMVDPEVETSAEKILQQKVAGGEVDNQVRKKKRKEKMKT